MISPQRCEALEQPERFPLFNFIFAASYDGVTAWQADDVGIPASQVPASCLEDAVDTLKRYPLDRVRWGYKNSHRSDVVRLPGYIFDGQGRGCLESGKVLPIDERFVEFWNHDPWRLDEGDDGRTRAQSGSLPLPPYFGLYTRLIVLPLL